LTATATITTPSMNKLESAFSGWLEHERLAGCILRWDFEPEKLRLADRTYYTPDFRVVNHDGQIIMYEGYAATIHRTMRRGGKQWLATVEWIETRSWKYQIPLTVERAACAHFDVSVFRTDPGQLDRPALIEDAQTLRAATRTEEDMATLICRAKDDSPVTPYKTWKLYVGDDGVLFRRHVPNVQEANALNAAGVELRTMKVEELAQYEIRT